MERGCPRTLQLLAEHGQEDSEVDGAAGLLHHGLQLLILHIQLAHGGQHVPQVVLADDAISVLVDDCESLPGDSWVKVKRGGLINLTKKKKWCPCNAFGIVQQLISSYPISQ